MWLSNKSKREQSEDSMAQMGTVTIAGNPASVYLQGERRNVTVVAPAGYHWLPGQKDSVLTLKSGEEQTPCILGKESQSEHSLSPGEVWISVAPKSGIYLRKDGSIELQGPIYLNGSLLSQTEVAL